VRILRHPQNVPDKHPQTGKPKLLIVDDNRDILSSLQMLLEGEGYAVRTAEDGQIASELQNADPADVLVTDIFMPGKEGMETIGEFRQKWPAVKIIAMSGGGQVATRDYLQVAADIGADAILRKPFDPNELFKTLSALLGR
jgi:DNA-binding response OmpR family regulator